jgi:hypothetical protein
VFVVVCCTTWTRIGLLHALLHATGERFPAMQAEDSDLRAVEPQKGGPMDEFLNVAVESPALNQFQVEIRLP